VPDIAEVRRAAVADREDEVRADEDVDLPELDLLLPVEICRGPEDDEQGVAVALQLRPLVRDDGVLDRELMQPELLRDGSELRVGRAEQADPGERVGCRPEELRGLDHGLRRVDAHAPDVHPGIDHRLFNRRREVLGSGLHRDLGGLDERLAAAAARTSRGQQESGSTIGHGA
jgi:hypothetical protein